MRQIKRILLLFNIFYWYLISSGKATNEMSALRERAKKCRYLEGFDSETIKEAKKELYGFDPYFLNSLWGAYYAVCVVIIVVMTITIVFRAV